MDELLKQLHKEILELADRIVREGYRNPESPTPSYILDERNIRYMVYGLSGGRRMLHMMRMIDSENCIPFGLFLFNDKAIQKYMDREAIFREITVPGLKKMGHGGLR